jgi:hypothetical protein
MKHPVDTSQWGEFLLNDIATLTNGNKFDKNKMSHDKPSINFVSRTGFNNGISDFVDKIDGTEPYPAGAITLALGGSVGSTFVQPKPFYTGQNVGVIEFDNKSEKMKQFVAVVLNKVCSTQFSAFKNEINKHFKRDLSIPLPLKPSADPENYTQDDIDWDYMDTVMSRVTEKAKDRLASLPAPEQRSKTPVDTSAWGEFVVGELFECDTTKTFYPNKSELPSGDTPYITRSTYDNGISGYYDDINNEFTIEGNCLTIGAEGGIAFWQPKPFVAGVKVYTVRHPQLNESTALFVASLLNTNSTNYNYTNARVLAKIQAETIKLPLKPSADPKNYTQEDIDWDYMDSFMQAVEEKAHERLVNLTHK